MLNTKISISVAMITYQAERCLDKVLSSVFDWVDDIVIVDSNSTDATQKIAKNFGAQIIHNEFHSYAQQKQFAVEQCKHDWVLVLDDDEIVSNALKESIIRAYQTQEFKAYKIKRRLVFLGHDMKFGNEKEQQLLRFFNRKYARFNSQLVHEGIITKYPSGLLEGLLMHHSFDHLQDYYFKMEKYARLWAHQNKGKKKSTWLKRGYNKYFAIFKFFIFDGLFLNGKHGWMYARGKQKYSIQKYNYLKKLL